MTKAQAKRARAHERELERVDRLLHVCGFCLVRDSILPCLLCIALLPCARTLACYVGASLRIPVVWLLGFQHCVLRARPFPPRALPATYRH